MVFTSSLARSVMSALVITIDRQYHREIARADMTERASELVKAILAR